MFGQQKKGRPATPGRGDALYAPNDRELQQREGGRNSSVSESSTYTRLSLRRRKPVTTALLLGGAAFAVWKLSQGAAVQGPRQPS
jgi:hypothetical protein